MGKGSLIVVGTGIRTVGQLTIEAIAWIKRADRVLHIVGDPIAEGVIAKLNPRGAESLTKMYVEGIPRIQIYNGMVDRILECVRSGMLTCLACYGHPGVFVYPSHEAIRRLRNEGFSAKMLPGISAEDCLFADLGIDPATTGCQSYEATDFLGNRRTIDPTSSVVLWQIGVIGDMTFKKGMYDLSALPLLVGRLLQFYPPTHMVYIYEAAVFSGCESTIRPAPLHALGQTPLSTASTLYSPPAYPPATDPRIYHRMNSFAPRNAGG
jgi:uncharacterized protein YabN with tetrapyrrole methylase and pyrophosphatase domain